MRLFGHRPLRSLDMQRRRRRRRRLALAAATFVGAAAVVGGSWLSSRPDFTIQTIQVSGSVGSTDASAIRSIAQEEMQGTYGYLFARANFAFYPKGGIRERILDSFSRIKEARVELLSPTSLAIAVSYRVPAFRWCGGAPEEAAFSDCYVADDRGVIFGIAPASYESKLFTIESGESGLRARPLSAEPKPLGFYALSSDSLAFVVSFKNELAARGIAVSSARFLDGAEELTLKNGVRILFDMRQPVPVVMNTLDSALETEAVRTTDLTDTPSRLEYLDVRFGERVYYKYAQ
ncbi:MAG: hypothetical protein HYS74_02465 [Parcubacteria group bacterium]|nr:hypothetical protein [Parcubacteria group bacterium]